MFGILSASDILYFDFSPHYIFFHFSFFLFIYLSGREIARMAYLNLHLLFPKKTEKIKSNISTSLRQRLIKEEVDKIGPILRAQELAQKKIQKIQSQLSSSSSDANSSNISNNLNNLNVKMIDKNCINNNDKNIDNDITSEINFENMTIHEKNEDSKMEMETDTDPEKLIIISPVRIANLRARRMSCEDSAVASIQALIRGRKCRRQTMSMQIPSDQEFGSRSVSPKSAQKNNKRESNPEYNDSINSPSLTSKAPFSTYSNGNLNANSSGRKNNSSSTDKNRYGKNGNHVQNGKIVDTKISATDSTKEFSVDDENAIIGLLKIKTNMMMNLFNEQLLLLEEIEKERNENILCNTENDKENTSKNILGDRIKYSKIVEKCLHISESEIDTNKEFQKRILKIFQ